MQIQGIVFIQLQGNDIVVNFQWNLFIQRTFIYSQKIYSLKEFIFVQGVVFISRKLYSFKEIIFVHGIIFIQRKQIHSRKFYSFKEMYPFKEIIFTQVQGNMFIRGNYIHSTMLRSWTEQKYYSINFHSHFMIIISFIIFISWMKSSYNSALFDWRVKNCWCQGFRIIITLYVAFAITIVRRKSTWIVALFRHTIFAKIWYARQRSSRLYLKKLLSMLQTVNYCSRYTICLVLEVANHIRSRCAFMRTSRKTPLRSRANLWITLVELTYPKAWTGSILFCPLIFFCGGMDIIKQTASYFFSSLTSTWPFPFTATLFLRRVFL